MPNTTDIQGYKFYQSYNHDMSNKIWHQECDNPVELSPGNFSITCQNVNIEAYPIYFSIASLTTDQEYISMPTEVLRGISAVNDFVILTSSIVEQPTSITSSSWANYQVSFAMKSTDDDDLGLMFRYKDPQNYYRFSWGKQYVYRRLLKCENGIFTLLAEDNTPYVQGQTYQISITANSTTLELVVDGAKIFSVADISFSEGSIAFYSWGNSSSYFSNLVVKAIPSTEILLSESFLSGDLSNWTQIDEGTEDASGIWSIASGELEQRGNIFSYPTTTEDLSKKGTFLIFNP
jgi:hypothetical protein